MTITVKLGGQQLTTLTDINLEYSLVNQMTRQYSVVGYAFTEEFIFIRDLVGTSDNTVIEIFIDNVRWLKGFVLYSNFEYDRDVSGGVTYRISGYDIFGALNVSKILKSLFLNLPIDLKAAIGKVLEELNYVSYPAYRPSSITSPSNIGKTIQIFQKTGSFINSNLRQDAIFGSDFIQYSNLFFNNTINPSEMAFKNDNWPRGDMRGMLAYQFINTLLQLKNSFMLSNGYDTLVIEKAIAPNINVSPELIIGQLRTNFDDGDSNVTSWKKGSLHLQGSNEHTSHPPCYQTTYISQINPAEYILTGDTTTSTIFSNGTCIDPLAIPQYQDIRFLNINASNNDLILLSQYVANIRRALKTTFSYTIEGTFYTNQNILYRPNRLLFIDDEVHGIQDNFLISDVRFSYSSSSGKSVDLTLVPQGSFTLESPEDILKELQKNRKRARLKQSAKQL